MSNEIPSRGAPAAKIVIPEQHLERLVAIHEALEGLYYELDELSVLCPNTEGIMLSVGKLEDCLDALENIVNP